MGAEYNDNFLSDMDPVLGDHYRQWLPFCRRAVLDTVDELAVRRFAGPAAGFDPSRLDAEALNAAWVTPFREYLQRSGKLLRPYLICLCMDAYGRDPADRPHQVGLAEIVHSSSLMLDDISDDSILRRGAPSAHQRYGTQVAGASASSWLNICFEVVWNDRESLGQDTTTGLIQALAWEHFVTGLGTTIDVTWPWINDANHKPDEYLQQVLHRSTSYTYRLPLKIGGWVAGADTADRVQLSAFGERIGLAFQLVDDVLNIKPGDSHWGKEVGEDISQGKLNLQVLLALQRLASADRARLHEILGSQTHDQELPSEATSLIERSGALDESLRLAQDLASEARQCVEALKVPKIFKERLFALGTYVLRRNR